ncbi:phosphoesterase RecJ domain-containing protein [Sporobacter termitidis DSM 10068]|uniref:Phosphoesterase RecJ domain-containing protein n=1 Tax=Sporobacter termitidis DSM 10068 TaxID=1123282 RepID=A0A1M5XXG6_9FIRM|nr:DHH family phosphoesterase [Sporobacter termitidis]SHI04507.1 phosphoesterase RecJ domain-containing protein [Sporobacter termitidis DSM 10068]
MTISETARWLMERNNFLVLTHKRPDGDTLGSAAGLVRGLNRAGKTAYILFNPEATARYTTYVEKHWAPDGFVPSCIVAVDTASKELFPATGTDYHNRVDLCIDHHPSNTNYAGLTCLDTGKSSCGEIIYALLLALNGGLDAEAATSLYVAVSTDTGCFAFANTTADTLRTAAALVDAGAPIGELNRELFRKKAKSRVLLEAMITASMEFYFDGAVAIAVITRGMLDKTGAGENELDDVASIPGAIEEVVAGITIRELAGGEVKVSVRTTPLVNANDLCARFGGGGHAMAAGFSLYAPVDEVKKRLLDALSGIFPLSAAQ